MFTVEIKINGSLIGHIYGHNEGDSPDGKGDKYRYEYYEPETREVRNGNVVHRRSDGIRKLVAAILNDAEPKTKKVLNNAPTKVTHADHIRAMHDSITKLRS